MKDKIVLITGSSEGIGRATAKAFAKEGAKLVLTYCSHKSEGDLAAKECKELGSPEVLAVCLDQSKDKSIQDCVKKVVAKFKKIDILINNAGVITWKPFLKQSFKEIEDQVRVNLEGLMKMTHAALPYVKEKVINIASGAGKSAHATIAPYCATKWGVRGFTQTMALESKIKFLAINPGATRTKMTGFTGAPVEKVADVILNAAKGKYKIKSGGDVDVWDYL